MRNVGFVGGSSISELGPVSDVVLFFECLNIYVVRGRPEQDWSLLTDRLYRRYLRLEELPAASKLMEQVEQIFATLPNTVVKWNEKMIGESNDSWLDPIKPTLAEIFEKYFDHFAYCVESAQVFFDSWKSYLPVKTSISDTSGYTVDKKRPLEDYDTLAGEPFWLQPA